jgi:cytochrome c biogenesis protein CcmG/thiol:disulfide interchange protein DsbE
MTEPLVEDTDVEAPGGPRTALVVSLVIGVLMAILVAVLATRDSSNERSTHSPLIGQVAPTVAGDTIEGEEVTTTEQRGRWVVVNFFASWCTPCREEHPQLAAFDAAHRAERDAVLVSVTFDDSAEDARDFFEEHGGSWPVIDDPENSIGVAFGVAQVPETFVISPTGVVVQRFAGAVTRQGIEDVIAAYAEAGR